MKLRLAFETRRRSDGQEIGPYIFLDRLAASLSSTCNVDVVSTKNLKYDLALYCNVRKSRLITRPYILRCGGLYFDNKNTAGDTEKLNQKIFKSIDGAKGVVFVSQYIEKLIRNFKGRISCPTVVIPNAVPLDQFSPKGRHHRDDIGLDKDEVVFVTSAKWRRHKRLKETIEVFQEFRRRFKMKSKLLVLGGGAAENSGGTIESESGIINVGYVPPEELPDWYRTGDIFLQLAWIEPYGNTQIEAMACGLPVICTNNGGIGESIISCSGGKVSVADKQYNFEMIDYYNPPRPDFESLLFDIEGVVRDLELYKERIDRSRLDINGVAARYVDFGKKVLSQ